MQFLPAAKAAQEALGGGLLEPRAGRRPRNTEDSLERRLDRVAWAIRGTLRVALAARWGVPTPAAFGPWTKPWLFRLGGHLGFR